MVKIKSNVYMIGGDAKVLYKKSTKLTTSYSSYVSNQSSILSFNIFNKRAVPIKIIEPENHCKRKITRDISIETDVCILRSLLKNKKPKCIGKRSMSGTFKYSNHCSGSGPRRKKRPDSTRQTSKLNTSVNRHYLLKTNLKQLFLDWIRTHEVCHENDKRDAEKVVDLIMHNINVCGSNTSSHNTITKLKKFLKFLSNDSLDSKESSITNEQKENEIFSKIPHSRSTIPKYIKKDQKQYQIISTLSVPRHVAIEKFCEPNQTTQQLYSIWISRQASNFYTDSSNFNYSVFSSQVSFNRYGKKVGTRYVLSKVQIGDQSLPMMPEDHNPYSNDSISCHNQERVVFLENTTNKNVIDAPKPEPNQDTNRKVFIIDQSISSKGDNESCTKKQKVKVSGLNIKEKSTDISIKKQLMYEATMVYKINNQIFNTKCDDKIEYVKTHSKTSQAPLDIKPPECTCKLCLGHKPDVCERATSDIELSLDVSRESKHSNKTRHKVFKESKKKKLKEKKVKERKRQKDTSNKSNTNFNNKLSQPSKFMASFGKLRHKNSYSLHKLSIKNNSKHSRKKNKEDIVDPVQKLIKDVECLFKTVTDQEDKLKIDIKINVFKKPVSDKHHATASHQGRIPRELIEPIETEYPNKQQVDDLKREISTKQLTLYENQLCDSAEVLNKSTTPSEITNTITNFTKTSVSSLNLEYSESSDGIANEKPSCSLTRNKSNDPNSKLLIKDSHVPKIVPMLNTNATSKTAYLFKHSLPNMEFFEHQHKSALYQVVNNMSKKPSAHEISEELKELRLVLQKLAATASKLIANHTNKINQRKQPQISYLSTGTEAQTPKSHVKSIRLMTTRETQKSKANTVQREVNTETPPKPKHSQNSGNKSMKKDPKQNDIIVKNLRLVKKSTSYNVIESETILKVTDMTSAANRSLKRSAETTVTYLYRKSNTKPKQNKARGNTMGYYYQGIVNRLRTHPQYMYDVCNYVPSCILSSEQNYYRPKKRKDQKYTSYFLQTFSVPSLYDCNQISLFGSDQCSECCNHNAEQACPESNNIWTQMLKNVDIKCASDSKSKLDDYGVNEDHYDSSKNCVNIQTYENCVTPELTHNNKAPTPTIPISIQINKPELVTNASDAFERCACINNASKTTKISSTRIDIEESLPAKERVCCWNMLHIWEKIIIITIFWISIITLVWVLYVFVIRPFSETVSNVKSRPTVIEIVPGPTSSNKGASAYNISHIYVNDELRNLTNVFVKLSDLGF